LWGAGTASKGIYKGNSEQVTLKGKRKNRIRKKRKYCYGSGQGIQSATARNGGNEVEGKKRTDVSINLTVRGKKKKRHSARHRRPQRKKVYTLKEDGRTKGKSGF